ncbi:uncharacterized protein LOC110986398 [Acanthaster planci]|uniref:Uncharacterized protein LOC110986398 n=1 Tax=Acanthaster planci TaxID=133434 RepID=A0A8B7ZG15_ACAPL|nr:uncharacterized protein LOC110986398 [Acanthaster planci]
MRPLARWSLVAVSLVALLGVVRAEKVCYFSQEPDRRQNGRLRWVLPGSKSDHCRCTSIWPGPLYTKPLQRSQEPFYTDTPIFTSDQEEIHHFFECHDPCSPNPCQNGGTCSQYGESFLCQCAPGFEGNNCDNKPLDCAALHSHGIRQSGVYTIYPSMYPDGLEVYCDMKPGYPYGWIVFQRRLDGSVNFTHNWSQYMDGFGNLTGEFWLGNEKLRQLTSKHKWLLQINLTFDDQINGANFISYRWPFRIEGDNYTLLEGSIGRSPLPLSQTPRPFSTYDKDNDGEDHLNCAALTRGGWWFDQCESPQDSWGNLNGEYFLPENSTDGNYFGIRWPEGESFAVVRSSEMKLRRFHPYDCLSLFNIGITTSGVYTIYSSQYSGSLEVYCDMDAKDGGWNVFQRRFNGSVNFNRNWAEYRDGFGDLTGEFWLGNEKLRQLTSVNEWLLQIDLTFDHQIHKTYRWLFRVEGDNYALFINGSTGDSPLPSSQTPRPFSTYDKDNDGEDHLNCAALTRGGWWFGQCESPQDSWSNLNGEYFLPENSTNSTDLEYRGIRWVDGRNVSVVLGVEMKLHRFRPYDCYTLYNHGIRQSGVYTIYPRKYPDGLEVYCDMDATLGGWTLFQRRFNGSVNFTRNWTEYQDGFGDLTGEFWLGNEKLRQLTSDWRWRLQIDLKDHTGKHKTFHAEHFRIEGNDYKLTFDESVRSNPLPPHLSGRSFSTYDMDNDEDTNANCAAELKGGWWLDTCNGTSGAPYGLNGEYQQGPNDRGITSDGWAGHRIVKSEMKLRRSWS